MKVVNTPPVREEMLLELATFARCRKDGVVRDLSPLARPRGARSRGWC
jgi:hypothetical protein